MSSPSSSCPPNIITAYQCINIITSSSSGVSMQCMIIKASCLFTPPLCSVWRFVSKAASAEVNLTNRATVPLSSWCSDTIISWKSCQNCHKLCQCVTKNYKCLPNCSEMHFRNLCCGALSTKLNQLMLISNKSNCFENVAGFYLVCMQNADVAWRVELTLTLLIDGADLDFNAPIKSSGKFIHAT